MILINQLYRRISRDQAKFWLKTNLFSVFALSEKTEPCLMISTNNVSLNYGSRTIFANVTIKFVPGNCYGLIGANGAGKSTFLKVLSGEIDEYSGEVHIGPGLRLSTLKQDHNAFDDEVVLQTVIMGDTALSSTIAERDAIYAKPDFSDEDGIKAGELEEKIEQLGGYEAESNVAQLLSGLGIKEELHSKLMKELTEAEKLKVLLAQALFGNPDILLLDEPTNDLDIYAIQWLEEWLMNFEKTVIVVSHDRHFLNSVCTHMADIDFGKITMFAGNYDFWYKSSQLIRQMERDQKKKAEDKAKQLREFIARFSANASKSKQATSRRKALEKLEPGEMKASTRKFPYVEFKPEREPGKNLLTVENLSYEENGKKLLDKISFELFKDDKVAIVGDELAITKLYEILAGKVEVEGKIEWGVTTSRAYFPADNAELFHSTDLSLIDWLRQFSNDKDESYIRGFLGRMLFSGEEATKFTKVLSGGEKVRMLLSKMMLSGANILMFDNPTSHLDLEAIQALNTAMEKFNGNILFSSHDQQLLQSVANRVFEINDGKLSIYDKNYGEYKSLVEA